MSRFAFLLLVCSALLPLGSGAETPASKVESFRDCRDCPDMVVIPAGEATLGSTQEERTRAGMIPLFGDREEPTYRVRFAKHYAIGRTEITRAQYRAFVEATHYPDAETCGVHDAKTDTWGPRPGYNWRKPGYEQGDDHPAVCISYNEAVAYTQWLSKVSGKTYRLPSDAEWEYAARAGTKTAWYWGDAPEEGCKLANILTVGTVIALGSPPSLADRMVCSSPHSFTLPVASFPPNAFGLYDMVGNAFEWAADCNSPNNTDAHADGTARTTGDCARHYLKGGAFHTPFWLTRSAVRGAPLVPDLHMFPIGFRVARSLD